MKRKISTWFLVTMAVAILFTTGLTTAVFYSAMKTEVLEELKNYAAVFALIDEDTISGIDSEEYDNLRITLIDSEGNVLYDNDADTADMSNHSNRPEVETAFEKGEGSAVRNSDTMKKNTFYYALLLDNGNVLRVAKESGSLWNIIKTAIPLLILIVIVAFIACYIITHFLTKTLLKPIEDVAENLDNLEGIKVYKEMEPFVTTIKKQHEDILQSAKIRQEFTANVSHELKTPLTAISGYSELIESKMAGPDETTRFAGEIYRNANRLLSLINDILKLSELDSGNANMVFENMDLYGTAKNCINMLELHAGENGVDFYLEGESVIVSANKNMLEEMIYNLCDNAVRYNHEGGNVWVTVNKNDKSITIADDGIGISEENQKRIFERFYRVDKSRSKKTGGTGLGLAIVKHIVEQHGAELELTSKENQGTQIKIKFNK